MIGSGVCRFRFIESLLALPGSGDSHTNWIRFLGAGQADTFISPLGEPAPECNFDRFQITATEPVTMTGHSVVITGMGATPVVIDLLDDDEGLHTVVLEDPLPLLEWAKITLTVESKATGCPGTLVMWVAHHPDNINQDGATNISDATAFGNEWNGARREVLIDQNCDEKVDITDATAFGNLFLGTPPATQVWNLTELPAKPL
ncbi:MAG: hypothetical protein IIA33_04580, partial [Planctomycetes bacterium]|nr:hypothetical protein [Planctomycetota bacterium]